MSLCNLHVNHHDTKLVALCLLYLVFTLVLKETTNMSWLISYIWASFLTTYTHPHFLDVKCFLAFPMEGARACAWMRVRTCAVQTIFHPVHTISAQVCFISTSFYQAGQLKLDHLLIQCSLHLTETWRCVIVNKHVCLFWLPTLAL